MSLVRSNIGLLSFICLVFLLGSCSIKKQLTEDEHLVKSNDILIDDINYSKHDPELIYNLESFVMQKPNKKFALIPREWLYYRYKEKFDSDSKKRGLVKQAELPVIHSDQKMFDTADKMEKYLRFSKGFYYAKVYPVAYLTDKKAKIEYHVSTYKQYTVRSKEYFCEDERVMDLINQKENSSLIKPGTPVDESIFDAEKARIVSIMQERGFANFSKNHIDFKADSSDMQVDVFATILPPNNEKIHRQFKIGQIKVFPDYNGAILENYPNVKVLNDIDYSFSSEKYFVKPNTLERAISMTENTLFRKNKIDNTYKSLAKLGTYRFINITSTVSPENDTIINYNIFLTPIIDTWAIDGNLNLFYSRLTTNSINRLGLSANSSLSNINAFGGGEKLSFSLEGTGEINLPQFLFSTASLKALTSVRFPRLIDPYNIFSKGFTKALGKSGEDKFTTVKNKVNTDLGLSYSYVFQYEQYITNSINASLNFEYKPNNKFTHYVTLGNINSLTTRVDSIFRELFLKNNIPFARSFDKYLITGTLQNYVFILQNPVFSNGFSWGMTFELEQSGAEVFLLNSLFNGLTGNSNEWAINLGKNNRFEFSKYFLANIDMHCSQIIKGKHSLAGRFRVGIGLPYALKGDGVTPYVKQYYVGGANSLRGWQTRQLGPGSHYEVRDTNAVNFAQTGDFVFETSVEYRFPIYYILEGALFVDAGNIWVLSDTDNRIGAQLTPNFYNDIALDYGFGLRLDLSFLLIRLDFGYKLRSPALIEDNNFKHWIRPEFNSEYIRDANLSIGINYPF